mgnify:CR=1 FL=1
MLDGGRVQTLLDGAKRYAEATVAPPSVEGAVAVEAGVARETARPPVHTKTVLATERSETASSASSPESVSSVPTEIASSISAKVVSPVAIVVSSVSAGPGISSSDEAPDNASDSLITR